MEVRRYSPVGTAQAYRGRVKAPPRLVRSAPAWSSTVMPVWLCRGKEDPATHRLGGVHRGGPPRGHRLSAQREGDSRPRLAIFAPAGATLKSHGGAPRWCPSSFRPQSQEALMQFDENGLPLIRRLPHDDYV